MASSGTAAGFQAAQIGSAIGSEQPQNGGFLFPDSPNIVDFLSFLDTQVQVPANALPPNSPWPGYALTIAEKMMLFAPLGVLYTLAVYNGATHVLFSITPDVAGQNYFGNQRSKVGFSLAIPSTGIVASTSDQGTSTAVATPEWAKGLTVEQLQMMKTPWGRYALQWNQSYGPTIWGLT